MQERPDSVIMRSASRASSLRHWPTLLHTITTNLWASLAVWIAANLRLISLSLDSDMSLSSPVTGLSTRTGLPAPNAAARGWKSPSPMYRKQSTSSDTDSAAVQLHPRTCPGYAMRPSPTPMTAILPLSSMRLLASSRSPTYWIVASSPTLPGSVGTASSSPFRGASERAST